MRNDVRDKIPRFQISTRTDTKEGCLIDSLVYFHVKYKQSISRVLYRSRGDNHLSRTCVAARLERRYPEGRRAASTLPYLVLLRVGFTEPASHLTASALLPHLSTLTRTSRAV